MSWDPLVRITHWLIAALFLANFWVLEEGDWHEWAGYAVLALLLVRWLWGFVGPANARFGDFLPTPARVKRSVREFAAEHDAARHEPRHTPLAGVMVMGLWLGLGLVGFTGWLQETDRFWGEQWLQQIHYWLANLVMAAVVLHVAAVVVIQRKFGLPLVRSMIRGR